MSWVTLFDWLLLGCNRRSGARHRKLELRKLQGFADSMCRPAGGSESAQDVLLFHFLVPAESDIDTAKRVSWHGRMLALVKMLERTFERTCKSLNRHSDDTKQTMARLETEVIISIHGHESLECIFQTEAIKDKADEMDRKLAEQFDALQARMERMENSHRTQFEALLRRTNDIAGTM